LSLVDRGIRKRRARNSSSSLSIRRRRLPVVTRANESVAAKETNARSGQLRAVGSQGERTRRRLLDAARKAFQDRGYAATRVDDITRRAGTSHGAFYLYFANKQDLLEALAVETSERMFALADDLEIIEPGEEGFESLRKWISRFVDAYEEHAPVVTSWIEAADDPRFDQLGADVLRKFAGKIAHAIHQSMEQDTRHPVHPGIAATALVAMIERLCYFWLVRGAPFGREETVDTLTAIWYEAMFGRDHRR
jgi:AcrR family transcriptional regulator